MPEVDITTLMRTWCLAKQHRLPAFSTFCVEKTAPPAPNDLCLRRLSGLPRP